MCFLPSVLYLFLTSVLQSLLSCMTLLDRGVEGADIDPFRTSDTGPEQSESHRNYYINKSQ